MSRSFKKSPVFTDGGTPGTKVSKRFANKKVRHTKDLPSKQRSAFRKVFCSYDIHDYVSWFTLEEAIDEWELEESKPLKEQRLHRRYESLEDYLQKVWYKSFYRK